MPAGFDAFYREAGERVPAGSPLPEAREPDIEALTRTAAEHGITITGPPPSSSR
ncbi:hypothetical protein [Pseudonocardia nigra]|uniref:hypothetical protein n=1 Tax=Pseudonocardia nigra TaxID=1921578 RepID=UPI001FE8AD7E|nr:hypothetical protein [Pseudonocardia nigra]